MAQADGVVDNGSGAVVRADINTQLAACFTLNSGATAPSTTYAYMWWIDTSGTPVLKQRNSTNTGWVTKGNVADTFLASSDIGSTIQAYDANTAKTNVIQTFSKPQVPGSSALSSGVAADFTLSGNKKTVTVNGGTFTISNPSAATTDADYFIRISYTTSHSVAWGTNFKGVSAVTWTATAGAVDHVRFSYNGSTFELSGLSLNAGA